MTKSASPSPSSFRHLIAVYLFIFTAWGFYRLLFRLPEPIEEVILKPLVWLTPLFYILYREKKSLSSIGWTSSGLTTSLIWGLGLGLIFLLEGFGLSYLKNHALPFAHLRLLSPDFSLLLGLSLATAVSEETVFRGFFFNRLWHTSRNELSANLISSLAWTALHVPVAIFIYKYSSNQLPIYLLLVFLFGIGSSIVFARTRNLTSSVLLHLLWALPIQLFR